MTVQWPIDAKKVLILQEMKEDHNKRLSALFVIKSPNVVVLDKVVYLAGIVYHWMKAILHSLQNYNKTTCMSDKQVSKQSSQLKS